MRLVAGPKSEVKVWTSNPCCKIMYTPLGLSD